MNRLMLFTLSMVLAAAMFAGCTKNETPPANNTTPPANTSTPTTDADN